VGDDLRMDSLLSLTSWLATRDRAALKLAIRHARCSNTHTNIALTSGDCQQWRANDLNQGTDTIFKHVRKTCEL